MGQRNSIIKGFIWTSMGTVGAGIINFIVLLVLARLLNPSDFGLLELIIIVTSISSVLIDSGFSQALIRDQEAKEKDLSSVFYLNVFIAIVLYLLLYFSAPFFASFFNAPELISVSRFGFLAIVFESFGVVPIANFSRKMQFKPIAQANIVGIIIAGCIGIALAFGGYGIWALTSTIVLLPLIRSLILFKVSKWKPSRSFSNESIKRYFKFGSFLLLQGLIDKFVINFESLAIGKFYVKSDLAYFSQARKLDAYFSQTLTNVIQKVTYPALSRISNSEERLKAGYRQVIGVTTFVIFPIMVFLIFFPDNFMWVVFGSKWVDAAPFLRWWCVFGLVYPLQSICNNIFYVTEQTKKLFLLSLLRQIAKVVIVVSLVSISVMAILKGIVIVAVVSAFIYIYFSGRLINYSLNELFKDIYINLFSAFFSAFITMQIFEYISINIYLSFACKIVLMSLFYFLMNMAIKNKSYFLFSNVISDLLAKWIKR